MENNASKFYPVLVAVFILCLMCTGLSAVTLYTVKASSEETEDTGTKEDYVKIAEQYEILPTTQISDAYKSGNTDGLSDKDRETLDMATAVIDEVIKDGMSDYEKEKAIFDWIVAALSQDRGLLTVIPQSGADSDKPYGVLKYKTAVCVGYATTFRMFMQMLDIPCMVVHESGKYHSWDLVQIENNWYHVDCYSAVGSGGYRYFNMPDSLCGQNWDRDFFPAADSFEYNYAYLNGKKTADIFDVAQEIKTAVDDNQRSISLLFGKNLTEHDAQIGMEIINNIQNMFWSTSDYSEVYMDASYYPTTDGYMFLVSITNNNGSGVKLTDEDNQAISDRVNEVFGDLNENNEESFEDEEFPEGENFTEDDNSMEDNSFTEDEASANE